MEKSKRIEQLREMWINAVVKIQGHSKEEAEKMYDKIQPHKTLK